MPITQKWRKTLVAKLTATPFQLQFGETPGVVSKISRLRKLRMPRVNPDRHLEFICGLKTSSSSVCLTCEHEMKYGPGITTRPHSGRCRLQITAELAKTDLGKACLGLCSCWRWSRQYSVLSAPLPEQGCHRQRFQCCARPGEGQTVPYALALGAVSDR